MFVAFGCFSFVLLWLEIQYAKLLAGELISLLRLAYWHKSDINKNCKIHTLLYLSFKKMYIIIIVRQSSHMSEICTDNAYYKIWLNLLIIMHPLWNSCGYDDYYVLLVFIPQRYKEIIVKEEMNCFNVIQPVILSLNEHKFIFSNLTQKSIFLFVK